MKQENGFNKGLYTINMNNIENKLSSILDQLKVQQEQISSLTKVVLKDQLSNDNDSKEMNDLAYKHYIFERFSSTTGLILGGVNAEIIQGTLIDDTNMRFIWDKTHESLKRFLEDISETILYSDWESLVKTLDRGGSTEAYIRVFTQACAQLVKGILEGNEEECTVDSHNLFLTLRRDKNQDIRLAGGFLSLKVKSL